MDDKQFIHRAIKNATVKVFVGGEFKGTGFFITSDGYILTAYHCIGEYPPKVSVKTRFDGEFEAFLDFKKSLRGEEYDIAVLKISYQSTDSLPFGLFIIIKLIV